MWTAATVPLPTGLLPVYTDFTDGARAPWTLQQVAPPLLLLIDGKMATDSDMDHDMEMLSDEESERYFSNDFDVIVLCGYLGSNGALPGLSKNDCRAFFFHMAQWKLTSALPLSVHLNVLLRSVLA